MSSYTDIADMNQTRVWGGVAARYIHGERVTLAVVELDADGEVPEHRHENEQLGLVLTGMATFTINGEEREIGPGCMYSIPAQAPHSVRAGSDGAIVVDIFAPPRQDWDALPSIGTRPPRWPA